MNKNVQRTIRAKKLENHQATKQERLQELKNRFSEHEITSAFQYGAICNSFFGKKRILSRQRINQIIVSKQSENRL